MRTKKLTQKLIYHLKDIIAKLREEELEPTPCIVRDEKGTKEKTQFNFAVVSRDMTPDISYSTNISFEVERPINTKWAYCPKCGLSDTNVMRAADLEARPIYKRPGPEQIRFRANGGMKSRRIEQPPPELSHYVWVCPQCKKKIKSEKFNMDAQLPPVIQVEVKEEKEEPRS